MFKFNYPQPKKKEIPWEISPEKVVYIVDGPFVRNNIWKDFTTGGNPSRYAFIPKEPRELWLDDAQKKEEYFETLVHEDIEDDFMQAGWTYEDAHYLALLSENVTRGILSASGNTMVDQWLKEKGIIKGDSSDEERFDPIQDS